MISYLILALKMPDISVLKHSFTILSLHIHAKIYVHVHVHLQKLMTEMMYSITSTKLVMCSLISYTSVVTSDSNPVTH